jgi:subtilisin family serine protease
LHDLPSTQWAQPDWTGNGVELGYAVSDEYFHSTQWNIKKTIDYKSAINYGAWELTRGSSSIRVAVLDRGMEAHEDFDTSKWDGGVDYTPAVGIDFDPSPTTPEPVNIIDAHGMAVLGIIAAAHNNPVIVSDEFGGTSASSTTGMAPMSRIIPVRIIDSLGSLVHTSKVANAINYAVVAGADVINCSWGYYLAIPMSVDTAIRNAVINGRGGKGCIVVAASGNNLGDLAYPASSDLVISVGAVRKSDFHQVYSTGGYQLDLVAPSGNGCSLNGETCQDTAQSFYTTDRMNAIGWNTKGFGNCFPSQDRDYVCHVGGTSFSAPQVTGVVALLLALEPNLTWVQVRDVLRKSAIKKDTSATQPGFQVDTVMYGQGRANAVRALSTVRRGDCNATGTINITDITYLNAYFFSGGPAPFPDKYFGDANCDGSVNVVDITRLVNYVFQGGPPITKPCTAFLLD